MTDQTRWGIPEVQIKNRARNYDKQNIKQLHEAQDIFKETNGLDNISEYTMKKFREIMLGGRQWHAQITNVKISIKMLVVGNLQIHEDILVVQFVMIAMTCKKQNTIQ